MLDVSVAWFLSHLRRQVALFSGLLLSLVFTGCGATFTNAPGGTTATATPTVSVAANPSTIISGNSSTVTVARQMRHK